MSFITAENLKKEYKILSNEKRNCFCKKQYEVKKAVDGISFRIEEGETVGYIGANGAGKSTTIKMLSGILTPSSGILQVSGLVPYKERKKHAKNIGVVFGQRTQLWWELPVEDSFALLKEIYRVPEDVYKKNLKLFDEILDLHQFFKKPVRQLSLGQRVRADFAASLIHDPKLVFLDEPTIGLDVLAKEKIRNFIKEINRAKKTTILITSHDMDDIEQICDRTMIIDTGKLIYDGTLKELKNIYDQKMIMTVEFARLVDEKMVVPKCIVAGREGTQIKLIFSKKEISAKEVLSVLMEKYDVKDFQLRETDIEEIIKQIYQHGRS